ncbi:MAG: thiamine biosynthesis protein ThiF [Lachnospiraceae bacterium]|nr:thiamine biosynthesis protein ThiF [Lachnospiraceae bacterium]
MIPSKEEWQQAWIARNGEALQQRFSSATVAICGLGGLGSNIAIALARAGIGTLRLLDFDRVDLTNLHRQQYKANQVGQYKTEALQEILGEIAPYTRVEIHATKVTEANLVSLLQEADIVCEAFDVAEAKAMLVNGVLEQLPRCYVVAASGMAGMDTPNTIQTRQKMKRLYVCGDGVSDVGNTTSLMAPRVMLCAAHQAHTVLRILAGMYEV